jgi:hypothetical protein
LSRERERREERVELGKRARRGGGRERREKGRRGRRLKEKWMDKKGRCSREDVYQVCSLPSSPPYSPLPYPPFSFT